MALAELWFGLGREQDDWICVGIRSGIGAGIVAGGELQRGANYRAGEIGRWRYPLPSLEAVKIFTTVTSSNSFELQETASVRAVLAAFQRAVEVGETLSNDKSGRMVFNDVIFLVKHHDEMALQIIRVAAESLAQAVAEIFLTMNPSRIVLSGTLAMPGDNLLEATHQADNGDIAGISGGNTDHWEFKYG